MRLARHTFATILLLAMGTCALAQQKGEALCFRYLGPQDSPFFPITIARSDAAAAKCQEFVKIDMVEWGPQTYIPPAEQFDKLFADADTFVLQNGSRTTPDRAIGCEILLTGKNGQQRFLPTKAMIRFLDKLLAVIPDDAKNGDLRAELLDRRNFLKSLR